MTTSFSLVRWEKTATGVRKYYDGFTVEIPCNSLADGFSDDDLLSAVRILQGLSNPTDAQRELLAALQARLNIA